MSIVVKKFGAGILYSNAFFVSKNMSACIAMERDGSITMRRNTSIKGLTRRYSVNSFAKFVGMNLPIRKIGMDKNGIITAFSDFRIQYPLKIEYNTYNFNSRDIEATLLDDCSFGVYDKIGNMVYRAKF